MTIEQFGEFVLVFETQSASGLFGDERGWQEPAIDSSSPLRLLPQPASDRCSF